MIKHIVIIPARNESEYILKTLDSLLNQTEVPDRIYIVDDGSSDDTAELVEAKARQNKIVHLIRNTNRGKRAMGGGVVEVFNKAYAECQEEEFVYISKLDADLIFPPDYFSKLLSFMDNNPQIAAASGILYDQIGKNLQLLRMPDNHVPGALKTVRKSAFDEMGGFIQVLGWDIVDLVKLRSMGYKNAHLKELKVIHQRQHASAEGTLKGKAQWGKGAYLIGSHPLFVFARGIYRMFEPPYFLSGIALWWGYLLAMFAREPQISDQQIIMTLRKEQLRRLVNFNKY